MVPLPPCRLFVILASDAPVGVILRRGPSKWVQIIRWDTHRDVFDDGAWFHGRIYEKYCDVSPDGELFVYFAAKHERVRRKDEYGYVWTAVSRPPWLFALALWPNPCGTYPGGGRFSDHRRLTLLNSGYRLLPHSQHPLPRELMVDQGSWRGFQSNHPPSELAGVDWSGRDQRGHLVYARAGKLFRCRDGTDQELADFNGRRPAPQPAPAWAKYMDHRRPKAR